jgi:magnesium transporter
LNNKLLRNVLLKNMKNYLSGRKATIWVDLQKATPAEYDEVEKTFNFHPLSMEDAKKFIELPKVEVFDNYIFVVLHSISHDNSDKFPKKREIDFFLGRNFIISVHNYDSSSVELLIHKFESNPDAIIRKADYLMYEIVDHFVDSYFPILEKWDDQIEELESNVIAHRYLDQTLKEIMHIKREVLYLKKSITPQRDVIAMLSRRDFPFICARTSIYFRDVYDHMMRVFAELEIQRDLITGTFEAYTSVLSNRLNVISNKMNEIMKRLTVFSTIFLPLTFLAGVYGMNFHFFPELSMKYGYFVFWAICIAIGVSMYLFFKKKKWA